ncbi:MAG: hypothetical protein LAT83_08010 [Kiritimatiellae bacterium]|nr:hypothetical protein [Kiritimatiellia bacterium]
MNPTLCRMIRRVFCPLFFTSFAYAGMPVLQEADEAIRVDFGEASVLEFAVKDGWLLGLRQARHGDHVLRADDTVLRPLVAQEYVKPGIWPFLKFESAEVVDGAVRITVDLYGGTDEDLFKEEFVFAPNMELALGDKITPELSALREEAEQARVLLNPLVTEDSSLDRLRTQLERERGRTEEIDPDMTWDVINNRVRIERFERALANAKEALYADSVETEEQRGAWETIQAFNRLRAERAAEVSTIHRDYYDFAHLQLPAETCRIDTLTERIERHGDRLTRGGRLVWVLRPEERNIAGWVWRGWAQHYEVELEGGHEVNNIRQVGTWELGGTVEDLTLVALRYRGLGGAEERIELDGDGQGARRAWSTTEILAGAAGRPPAVSPVIPPAAGETLEDRGYALQHRLGAWISKPGRGAGAPFVDFQSKNGLTLISSFDTQGALRSLTEIFPGDRHVSQLDEQWFANTSAFATKPQLYLVLEHSEAHHELVTRWQEVDQHFRDVVAAALDFRQVEPLPGVGWLDEHARPGRYRGLAEGGMEQMIERGVRMKVTHTPGWYTEQHRDGPARPATPGGNSNRVFDWIITDDVREGWKGMREVMRAHNVPYFIYLGGMVRPDGPFAHAIGADPANWGMNRPESGYSHGYPPLVAHNVRMESTRELLTGRLLAVQEELGMDGLWGDSFQNMYMSQLTWGDGSGAPMQETWWPLLAEWTRRGIHFMSESHAFPGLSCSIELQGWEDSYSYFQYVWKWLRGTSQRNYTPEQLDHMAFRFMANKSAIAPEWDLNVIPSFTRYSAEYMAALPSMRRSWVLPGEGGMLWLPYDRDDEGVWFSFADQPAPEGVRAVPILGGDPADTARKHHTYAVRGEALPETFGMRPAPSADPRKEKPYEPVAWKFFDD